jgi:hypothetical protein
MPDPPHSESGVGRQEPETPQCQTDEVTDPSNAELDTAIRRRAASISFGDQLATEGVVTVALAEDGSMVEYRPDGSSTIIAPAPSSD